MTILGGFPVSRKICFAWCHFPKTPNLKIGQPGVPGPMEPKTNKMKKEANLKTKCWFGKVFQFPGNLFFFLMFFCRRPFNQKPLVFRKIPRTHLEVQGSFGDEGTFQECQKSWFFKNPQFGETENWRHGVYFDAEYLSAPSCHAQTAWIAIWSIFFLPETNSFFSFSIFWP